MRVQIAADVGARSAGKIVRQRQFDFVAVSRSSGTIQGRPSAS
jgi:hypothetical protein